MEQVSLSPIDICGNRCYSTEMNLSNTNWNLYKTFKVVFETRNLARASGILGTSRAAVGQNIKELGNQLGIKLFTPHRRGVEPTLEAQNLYPSIKIAFDAIVNTEASLETFDMHSSGIIRIAVASTTAELFIKDYLQQFRVKYSNVRIELSRGDSIDLLKQRKIDLVVDLDYFFTPDVKTIELFTVYSTFAATEKFLADHGLSASLTCDELLAQPIVVYGKTWDYLYKHIDAKAKVGPSVIRTDSTDLNFSIMKNSIAIGYLGYYRKEILNDPELVEINVSGITIPPAKMVVGFHRDPTRAAQIFLDMFREQKYS